MRPDPATSSAPRQCSQPSTAGSMHHHCPTDENISRELLRVLSLPSSLRDVTSQQRSIPSKLVCSSHEEPSASSCSHTETGGNEGSLRIDEEFGWGQRLGRPRFTCGCLQRQFAIKQTPKKGDPFRRKALIPDGGVPGSSNPWLAARAQTTAIRAPTM